MSMAASLNHGSESDVFSNTGQKLYMQEEKADVYFIFESTSDRIPAHKLLLASGSDVFDAMFYGPLKEEGDIKMVDISADAFKEFLQFFYFNRVPLSIENVADVMYLGNKYDVKECLLLCSNWLTIHITTDNVMSALSLAIMYDQKPLLESCECEIRSHLTDVLQSPCFLECERQLLGHILQMDDFDCSETELFEASMSWVKANSKQDKLTRDIVQTHLGDLFYRIRFGSMSLDDFYSLLPSYERIFSDEEYNEIVQVISGLKVEHRLFIKCRPFWDDDNVIACNRNCNHYSHGSNYPFDHEESTTFSTNTSLLLGRFTCTPIYNGVKRVASLRLAATITANFKVLTNFSFNYSYNRHVDLPTPIKIRATVKYSIRLTYPTTQQTRYNTFRQPGLKLTVSIGRGIKVVFVDQNTCGNSVGSIIGLGFNSLQ